MKRLWSTATEVGQGAVYRTFAGGAPCFPSPTLLAVSPPNCDLWEPLADNQFAHLPQAFAPDVEIDTYPYDDRFIALAVIPPNTVFVNLWTYLDGPWQYDVFLAASFCYCPGEGVTRPGLTIGRPRFPNVSLLNFFAFSDSLSIVVDPWHPFKGRLKTTSSVEIGYKRPYDPPDMITIVDQADTLLDLQLRTVTDDTVRTIAGLAGEGFLYYLLRRTAGGIWSLDDTAGQVIKNSATWPPDPDDRAGIPLLLGSYANAGDDDAAWYQSLRENPYLWPRPMQPDFFPFYYWDNTNPLNPKRMVAVSEGSVFIRSVDPGTETRLVSQQLEISSVPGTKSYYYVVMTFNSEGEVTAAPTALISAAPLAARSGYTYRYLVGYTDNTRYWPYFIGSIQAEAPAPEAEHPFRGRIDAGEDGIDVGIDRSTANDEDTINIYDAPGAALIAIINKVALENVAVTDSGYIYYELSRTYGDSGGVGGAWTATLVHGIAWPPATDDRAKLYVPVGKVIFAGGKVTEWQQWLFSCPTVTQRNTFAAFSPIYTLDEAVANVHIIGGTVRISGAAAAATVVNGEKFRLDTSTEIWVQAVYDYSAGTVTVNNALQSGIYPGLDVAGTGGDRTIAVKIGEITGGYYRPHHLGDVQLPNAIAAATASAAYDGPWAVSASTDPGNADMVMVGENRSATRPDLCIVHPSNVFSKISVSPLVTVTDNGVIYVTITREGTVDVSDPAFATTLPAQTDTTIAWPLAYVTFADNAVTGIWQAQYGQIITYETVECACAELP